MSLDACAGMVRAGDPERFRAAMFAPLALRGRLMALYAFNLEVARAPWVAQEPLIAQMRLQFWKDAVAEIYDGKLPRRHPVILPLADVITAANLPRNLFDGLIDARHFDISRDSHSGMEEFDIYIENTSGNLMELAARSQGAGGEALPVIRDFAFATGVANLFAALPVLYAAGRDPIPSGWVPDRAGIAAGEMSEPLIRAVTAIADRAIIRLHRARAHRHRVPSAALPVLLAGLKTDQILRNALKSPENLLRFSGPSEFQYRWALLWRGTTGRW